MEKTIKEKIIDKIAKEVLGINTLDTQNSDKLDFHDLPVWKIKEALEQAFNSGVIA